MGLPGLRDLTGTSRALAEFNVLIRQRVLSFEERGMTRRAALAPQPAGRPALVALLRRLLLSDYFVLYLSLAYFAVAASSSRRCRAAQPRQPAVQRVAAAGGRGRPDLRADHRRHRPLAGATMGLTSIVGAVLMTTAAAELLSRAARSGGRCSPRAAACSRGAPGRGGGHRRHAAGRRADRAAQRRSSRASRCRPSW